MIYRYVCLYVCIDAWPHATLTGAATRHGFFTPCQRIWNRVGGEQFHPPAWLTKLASYIRTSARRRRALHCTSYDCIYTHSYVHIYIYIYIAICIYVKCSYIYIIHDLSLSLSIVWDSSEGRGYCSDIPQFEESLKQLKAIQTTFEEQGI